MLLVGAPDADVALVRDLLARTAAMRFELSDAPRLQDFLAQPDAPRFDVILLQVSASDLPGLAPVARARLAAPSTPIVVLAEEGDESARCARSRAARAASPWRRAHAQPRRRDRAALESQRMILQLHSARERARHLATHDQLTGLANRALFHDRLAQAMFRRSRAASARGAVRRPRRLQGDQRLARPRRRRRPACAASRAGSARACARPTPLRAWAATSSRVLLTHLADARSTRRPSRASCVAELPSRSSSAVRLTRSAAASASRSSRAMRATPSELIKRADTAMYHAKESGGGRFEFYTERDERRDPEARRARGADAHRARRRRVRAPLPAAVRPQARPHHRRRGAAALEAPRARPGLAGRISCRSPRRPA